MIFTIVTPTFNSERYIGSTIESVLRQQGRFSIDYIIVDNHSTDSTVDVVRKYQNMIAENQIGIDCNQVRLRLVVDHDEGMYDAINKGFSLAQGDVLAWINSDDIYFPGAFMAVAEAFRSNPSAQWIVGKGFCVDNKGKFLNRKEYAPITYLNMLFLEDCVMQPTAFWRKALYSDVGGIDTHYQFSFDYDLFLKFVHRSQPVRVHHDIAAFRMHPQSKTETIYDVCIKEDHEIHRKYYLNGRNPVKYLTYWIFGNFYQRYYSLLKRISRNPNRYLLKHF